MVLIMTFPMAFELWTGFEFFFNIGKVRMWLQLEVWLQIDFMVDEF